MTDNGTATQSVLGLRPVDPTKAGWKDEPAPEGMIVKRNANVGAFGYGTTPAGYDQPVLHANSGSPVLGYCFVDGELYLMALMVGRWNIADGMILPEVPGGFATIDPETGKKALPKKGALRELAEETGLDLDNVIFTCGAPYIGDRAFFVKDAGEGNNVYMFELTEAHRHHIAMRPGLQLLHWTDFVKRTTDGITLGAIMRVIAALAENSQLKVNQADA